MSFESGPSLLSPQERQDAIQYVLAWIQMVMPMGGNDEELPKAQRYLAKLQSNELVAKEEWERMKAELGDPHDKNSNYH